jgi:beta-glucanase (GH16 family)
VIKLKTKEMKHLSILVILIVLCSACQEDHKKNQSSIESHEFKMVWNDEFEDDGELNSDKWGYDLGGHGWGNNELQFYTDRKENVRIENGILIIEARKELYKSSEFTSARVITKNKGDWKYGKVEVKAKIPDGRGTWPAIWMLPTLNRRMSWPLDGEIDIMEHVGFDKGQIYGTVHTEAYNHNKGTQRGAVTTVDDATEEFHVYSIEWNADRIEWFVDNEKYHVFKNEKQSQKEWPFDNPFHLILNIAVGGSWGGQQGVDDSIWPRRMEVDWVRVYQ